MSSTVIMLTYSNHVVVSLQFFFWCKKLSFIFVIDPGLPYGICQCVVCSEASITPELIGKEKKNKKNLMFEFLYLTSLDIEKQCQKAENYRGFPNIFLEDC